MFVTENESMWKERKVLKERKCTVESKSIRKG